MNDDSQLAAKIEALEGRVRRSEAVEAVRKLQYMYGYFLDKFLYDEIVELFHPDAVAQFENGIYRGRAGIERLFHGRLRQIVNVQKNGPAYGRLVDHLMGQGVVHVSPDGMHAEARFRTFTQFGVHESVGEPIQRWSAGLYENEYAVLDGTWRITQFNYYTFFKVPTHVGWAYATPRDTPNPTLYPTDPVGPDEHVDVPIVPWPETSTFPFHYDHPVTGASLNDER